MNITNSMNGLSEETMERIESVSLTPHRSVSVPTMWLRWMHAELRRRRDADRALADVRRLADVVDGYIQRHGFAPNATTVDLIDAIAKYMKERGDA